MNVLIVEDSNTNILKQYLKENDTALPECERVRVVTKQSAAKPTEDVDAILLDGTTSAAYVSPETFAELYSQWPNVPVVVVAANENAAAHAVECGACESIIKNELGTPVLHRALRNAVSRGRMLDKLKSARELEHHLIYHDALTSLPNRLKFRESLAEYLYLAKKNDEVVALLCIDIDQFKRVNDSLGHDMGDQLLQQVAKRLTTQVQHKLLSRLGDDEFTIVLDQIGTVEDAAEAAQKILQTMIEPFEIEGYELYITVSIGMSLYPFDGTDITTLIKKADIAMYRAKNQGRNRYEIYEYAMDEKLYEYFTLENSLRKAILHKQLLAYFQPQMCLSTGKVAGVEALIRWQHPRFGFMQPDKFIDLAEESGVIVQLDQWMLRASCEKLKDWQEEGFGKLRLGVNLSAHQFRLRSLIETIEQILSETDLAPENVCLEITESDIMRSVDTAVEIMTTLKEMGLLISVDDFGTGYASFHNLKQFPIDILKIDHSFVQGIPEDRNNTAISTAIINMAKSMGLKVIAEGVETRAQLEYLQMLRCDEVQGFYFSRPVAEDKLSVLLKNDNNGSSMFLA